MAKKDKVVVTGGAGFIGSHLVDRALEEGFEVHVIDDLSNGKRENVNEEAILHEVSIVDLDAIKPIVNGSKYVFHLAALPRVQFSIDNPVASNEVNVVGTINVLKASHEAGVKKVIFSSSGSTYGDPETLPVVETMPVNPLSPYALQKYIGEQYCKLWGLVYGLDTVCLRYFNIYGRRMDPEGAYALVVAKFAKYMKEGKKLPITGDGKQTRDFTHVKDAVEANMLAAYSDEPLRGEVFNIGFGNRSSVNDIAELFGGEVEYVPERLEPKHNEADNQKALRVLKWKPVVKLEEGIEEVKKEWGL